MKADRSCDIRGGPPYAESVDSGTRFERFVVAVEPSLRAALVAAYGGEVGREACADALAYGWEHWSRVESMDNAAGYLYRVGQSSSRRYRRRRLPLDAASWVHREDSNPVGPWSIADGLGTLTRRQRTVVVLVDGYSATLQEVADLLGLRRSSVQNHLTRGRDKLRDFYSEGN